MIKDWQVTRDVMRVMLLRRGRSAEDADDLMQEAWLRYALYRRRKQVASPGAFMVRTALNLAASADRSRAARGEEVAAEELPLPDGSPDIEATVLARERLARLDACLDRLGSRTRAIFLDIRVGGMTFSEAAEVHGISVSGVEKHVTQAAVRISQWMEGWRT
jgi:RNA polymerase sigma factor (sigma-70 family)